MSTQLLEKIEKLNKIGIALSARRDTNDLLTEILKSSQELTLADGGTLYRLMDGQLHFDVVLNHRLNFALGKTFDTEVHIPPMPLKLPSGEPNLSSVATYVANNGETVNIQDIYKDEFFDFTGALNFDKANGYRTRSMLVVPLTDFNNDVIGVLQLINAENETGEVVPFSLESESLARSLASQASVAISNQSLVDEHKALFDQFSIMIADTIDKKSPYTGRHCMNVPVITMMLADAAIARKNGTFGEFSMNQAERHELEMSAWLHDCGKLTTPEYIMDKSTKLETVVDRIALLKTRLNLKAHQDLAAKYQIPKQELEQVQQEYLANYERLEEMNQGGHFFKDEEAAFLAELASQSFVTLDGVSEPLLSDDEVYNLSIERGTLNPDERKIMENHAMASIEMLNMLPFPKELQNIPEYAGGHHERMDGQGYPRHLKKEELSVPARMMGIADIFEALSASDRPYKKAKKISECLKILGFMKLEGHIDPELFDLFVEDKVYLRYAQEFLSSEQIDEVDHSKIPGYTGKI